MKNQQPNNKCSYVSISNETFKNRAKKDNVLKLSHINQTMQLQILWSNEWPAHWKRQSTESVIKDTGSETHSRGGKCGIQISFSSNFHSLKRKIG